jgi:single-strand DNA-binding protein
MNKVILMGRLTRDPEVRYSQGATPTAVARFSIAVDRRFKREGEPDADFFNCTCFGKQGEFVEKYLHKGTKVVLSGRVQNDNYTNKEGQQVYGTRIMVDEIEFAESKNAAGNGDNGYNNNGGNYGNNNGFGGGRSQAAPSGAGDGFMNIPDGIDEELPFN